MFDDKAVNAIAALAHAQTFTATSKKGNTVLFSDSPLTEVKPTPEDGPSIFKLSTLKGFADAISEKVETLDPAAFIIHVVDYKTVKLVARASDIYGRRMVLIEVTPVPVDVFEFNKFLDHETFVIQALTRFVLSTETPDLDYILQVSSSLSVGATATSEDDGVAQRVTVKRGMTLGSVTTLKNRVRLAPYRTFPEVNQVVSEFIFRAKGGGDDNAPSLALIEADGGRWKNAAITEVTRFIDVLNTGIPVIS